MSDHENLTVQVNRSVKTLLLTKINHDNYSFDSYRGMYDCMRNKRSGSKFLPGKRYLSLGSIDAFSLYDTASMQILKENNWFGELYKDRKEIILESSENICYHPIHLIANVENKADSEGLPSAPFCLVTLIYGITEEKEELQKLLPREDCQLLSENEWKINALLKKINKNASDRVEVYNAVNLCDAVIIWHTDDIVRILKYAEQIAGSGFARKTFTIVGIQWSENKHFITDEAKTALHNHNNADAFSLKIQGSIRDRVSYDTLESAIVGGKTIDNDTIDPITNYVSYSVPGQADFTIVINSLSGPQLVGILFFYLFGKSSEAPGTPYTNENCIDLVSPACWDIHTDLLFKTNSNNTPAVVNGGPIEGKSREGKQDEPGPEMIPEKSEQFRFDHFFAINNPTETIISIYKKYCSRIHGKMADIPWQVAFFELLTVHASIDRHPVLSGTAYLIRRFLEVTYFYLNEYLNGKTKDDRDKAKKVLDQSQETLQEVIRVWGVLTEQMLRIDDFVFRGIGNSSVLFNTLPECALDFYHAFLHQYVDILLDIDKSCDRIQQDSDYNYDFLLLPELDRKISILPVFNADSSWKPEHDSLRQLGPPKQVFIVYFPIETVFSPIGFFAPLLHECFHFFGDACRLRGKRTLYFCRFLANLIVANISGSWYKEPNHRFFKLAPINEIIYEKLRTLFENSAEKDYQVEAEPTEQETFSYLALDRIKGVLCTKETARELCDRLASQITCEFGFDILSLEGLRLRKSIYDIFYGEYENTAKTPTQYLDIGIWLESGIQKIFVDDDEDGLKLIQYSAKVDNKKLFSAYKKTIAERKIVKKDRTPDAFTNWEKTLKTGWYYYKECYADLMMIQILDLEPDTYLSLFWNEMQDEKDWISTALRIALVLATAFKKEGDNCINDKAEKALSNVDKDSKYALFTKEQKAKQLEVASVIRSITMCLLQPDVASELAKNYTILPTATWIDIFEYLVSARSQYNEVLENKQEIAEKVKTIQALFTSVFKSGGFLSNEFFNVISEHHNRTLSLLNHSSDLQSKINSIISNSKDTAVTAALQQLSMQLSINDAGLNAPESAASLLLDSLFGEIASKISSGDNDGAIKYCKTAFDAIKKEQAKEG